MQNIIPITNDIILEKYDSNKHDAIIQNFKNDKALAEYFKIGDDLYILKYKGEYSGFYLFHRLGYLKNSITMECGIVKELRSNIKTGQKGIGSEVLAAITDYLLKKEAENIVLEINYDNAPSIKSALKCGYLVSEPLQGLFYDEGYKDKVPYFQSR